MTTSKVIDLRPQKLLNQIIESMTASSTVMAGATMNFSGVEVKFHAILNGIYDVGIIIIIIKGTVDIIACIKDKNTKELGKTIVFYLLVTAAVFGLPTMLYAIRDIFR